MVPGFCEHPQGSGDFSPCDYTPQTRNAVSKGAGVLRFTPLASCLRLFHGGPTNVHIPRQTGQSAQSSLEDADLIVSLSAASSRSSSRCSGKDPAFGPSHGLGLHNGALSLSLAARRLHRDPIKTPRKFRMTATLMMCRLSPGAGRAPTHSCLSETHFPGLPTGPPPTPRSQPLSASRGRNPHCNRFQKDQELVGASE